MAIELKTIDGKNLEENKMYIKLFDNASQRYIESHPLRYIKGSGMQRIGICRDWTNVLRKIEGKILEVDTEYLFVDMFNTTNVYIMDGDKKIKVNSEGTCGFGIESESVEKVFFDKRPFWVRCSWCGKLTKKEQYLKTKECNNCNRSDHIIDFSNELSKK